MYLSKLSLSAIAFLIVSSCKLAPEKSEIFAEGLSEPVEILRDRWGVNHIYAKNQKDLFFAQGYAAAKDRLFQFEIWRRQATGTVAEILGPDELKRDIGTRLFQFRGDLEEELNHYHPQGSEIINAYTDGVNAYIEEILKTPEKLPIEFKILDIYPGKWTPDVVISRHQGLKGNVNRELQYGMAVAKIGEEKVKELMWFHPNDPIISLDPKIDGSLLSEKILELHKAYASGVQFEEQDIDKDYLDDGSNNWAITGSKAENGFPLLANDPHRRVALPSLRYMVHLVAPGWNVIGGGEPEIPGVSIGHNEYGAWGLTIFRTDGEDLYVYDLNPENLSEYKYKDEWVAMQEIQDEIAVKGQGNVETTLRYSVHGPVTYIDSVNYKGYAVKSAWLEKGGAPYLASLRMDQSQTWEEFKDACTYSNIPAENMVWADKEGNIGWQAVGITPIRKNHSGIVPVPGDGSYDWEGYLPIEERPNSYNPEKGYLATANQNVTSPDYKHQKTLNYVWSDSYRGKRIDEVLSEDKTFTMRDMEKLQSDYLSMPGRLLVPMLQEIKMTSEKGEKAKNKLLQWNYVLDGSSVEAAIYAMWERIIRQEAEAAFIPSEVEALISIQMEKIVTWLQSEGGTFGPNFKKLNKREFLQKTFELTVNELNEKLGDDMTKWQYGQASFKHSTMKNALSQFVNDSIRAKIDLGTLPRGGNSFTPNSTGNNDNQISGGSFKFITDLSDWDKALMINSPGQSGNPDSKYYSNLFELWAKNEYFPSYYSREKIEKVTDKTTMLQPK
ncbi:penicillin acylase family protein [Maribacter sp. 2308TA10-17]|uniref:penicillin acylase family protein n=1 Tax=Maribacter sp. 2308TA10-17 TaxID=3386276 RepID=UPI0039BCCF90